MPAGPAPVYMGALADWPVTGSILVTVPSLLFATQTACVPTAMPSGRPPTPTVLVTAPVTGLIRITVSSPWLATHTPLRPAAMATGRLPTEMGGPTGWSVAGLIRDTVPSPLLATHTSPFRLSATALGLDPTSMWSTTACVTGLI